MHALHQNVTEAVIEYRTLFDKAFMILLLSNVINPSIYHMHIEYKFLLEGTHVGYGKLHDIICILNEFPDSVKRYSE